MYMTVSGSQRSCTSSNSSSKDWRSFWSRYLRAWRHWAIQNLMGVSWCNVDWWSEPLINSLALVEIWCFGCSCTVHPKLAASAERNIGRGMLREALVIRGAPAKPSRSRLMPGAPIHEGDGCVCVSESVGGRLAMMGCVACAAAQCRIV